MLAGMPGRRWRLIALPALTLSLTFPPRTASSEDFRCHGVDDCVRQLVAESRRQHDRVITGRERELEGQLVELGAPAAQALIPLLESADARAAGAAAHALSRFGPGAKPALAALGRSFVRGNGWASLALEESKEPAAIPLLVAGALAGQPTAAPALMRLGPAGQRAVGEVLAKSTNVELIADELTNALRFSTREGRGPLVEPLAQVAKDVRVPLKTKKRATSGDAARSSRGRQRKCRAATWPLP
jgi:hypothetical protein